VQRRCWPWSRAPAARATRGSAWGGPPSSTWVSRASSTSRPSGSGWRRRSGAPRRRSPSAAPSSRARSSRSGRRPTSWRRSARRSPSRRPCARSSWRASSGWDDDRPPAARGLHAGHDLRPRRAGSVGPHGSGRRSPGSPGTAGAVGVIAVGIGVNLGQRAFPAGLAERATSVLLETGKIVERDAALAALLEAFDGWRAQLERDGLAPVRARWLALADTIGRRVSVDGVTGVAVDLDADGALVLEVGGRRHRVVAGELGVVRAA